MQAYEERAPVALCLPCSPHRLLSIYENPEREKKSWGPLGCELWAFDVRLFEFYPWRTRQCPLVWIGRLKVLITTCSTSHLFQIHDLHVSCDMCFFCFLGRCCVWKGQIGLLWASCLVWIWSTLPLFSPLCLEAPPMKDQREVPMLSFGVWFPTPVNLYVVTCPCCKKPEKWLHREGGTFCKKCEQLEQDITAHFLMAWASTASKLRMNCLSFAFVCLWNFCAVAGESSTASWTLGIRCIHPSCKPSWSWSKSFSLSCEQLWRLQGGGRWWWKTHEDTVRLRIFQRCFLLAGLPTWLNLLQQVAFIYPCQFFPHLGSN